MTRGSYGDKFTISVMQGETHVTFDFTSRVLDFVVMCATDEDHTVYDEGEMITCALGIQLSIGSLSRLPSSFETVIR